MLNSLYANLTREATLTQNILNALRIFARISKFRCFYETKQTQNEVGRFFYILAEFSFEYFWDNNKQTAFINILSTQSIEQGEPFAMDLFMVETELFDLMNEFFNTISSWELFKIVCHL